MEIHMKAIVPLGLLVALSSQAGAATVCPSTGSGPVTCTDPDSSFSVTYNPSEAGLFGTMVLSNNSILFTPDAFSANSNSSNFTTETFNLTLTATVAGFDFGSFSLTERGDYMLNGNSASVQAFGEMRVRYGETDPPFDEFRSDFLYEAQGDLGFGEWDGSTVIDSSTMTQMGNTWVGTDGMVGRQVFLASK